MGTSEQSREHPVGGDNDVGIVCTVLPARLITAGHLQHINRQIQRSKSGMLAGNNCQTMATAGKSLNQ